MSSFPIIDVCAVIKKGIIFMVFGKDSMTNQFSDLIRIIGITILITVTWAASIALTYWDTHQQRLPAGKALLWLLLVILLPVIGFIIYIFFRVLALLLPIINNGLELKPRRETALKHPLVSKRPTSTILASDLDDQTALESQIASQPDADHHTAVVKCVLTVSSGANLGKQFILEKFPAIIGRGSRVIIRLDEDLGVSREHAEIYEQADTVRIRDLKSNHGTQVNGLRIEDQRLESGDRIQLGLTVMVVKITRE